MTDLAAGPDGALWVSVGLAHQGGIMGGLSRLGVSGWTTVAKIAGFSTIQGKAVVDAHLGWDLPLASFDALAFDEHSQLHVLTGELGVVRRDGERWTRLTPGWPRDGVYGSGLAVRGGTLVIATFDAGILLWDVATGKARQVGLPR